MKHPNDVNVDNYGLTLVDLKNLGHKDDPWVLADRVAQVFYVLDPETGKYLLFQKNKKLLGLTTWKTMTRMSISLKRCHYSPIQ
jgi:hypothetical protein